MSLTIIGILISVAGTILLKLGFSEVCSNEIVSYIPLFIGGAISWVGRVRAGGINLLGMRK